MPLLLGESDKDSVKPPDPGVSCEGRAGSATVTPVTALWPHEGVRLEVEVCLLRKEPVPVMKMEA